MLILGHRSFLKMSYCLNELLYYNTISCKLQLSNHIYFSIFELFYIIFIIKFAYKTKNLKYKIFEIFLLLFLKFN